MNKISSLPVAVSMRNYLLAAKCKDGREDEFVENKRTAIARPFTGFSPTIFLSARSLLRSFFFSSSSGAAAFSSAPPAFPEPFFQAGLSQQQPRASASSNEANYRKIRPRQWSARERGPIAQRCRLRDRAETRSREAPSFR